MMCPTPAPRVDIQKFITRTGNVVVLNIFYGLGADGMVGQPEDSIKIIGEETAGYAQGLLR